MKKRPREQDGFTLIEIIVAIAIFGVIISMIYPAYTGTYRNIEIAENQAEIYEMARITLIRIVEDLESAYMPEEPESPEENNSIDSLVGINDLLAGRRADKIRFYSKSHIDIRESDREAGEAKIVYYPLLMEDESISLYRSDTPGNLDWPEENTRGWIICEDLHSVSFTYRDKDGDNYDEWGDTYGNAGVRLPSVVNITIAFINREDPDAPLTFSTAVAIPLAD